MTPIQELALQLTCGTCDAGPGVWCRTGSGRRASSLHTARTSLLWLAYGLGRINGARDERVETAVRVLSLHRSAEVARTEAELWASGRRESFILGPVPPRIMG